MVQSIDRPEIKMKNHLALQIFVLAKNNKKEIIAWRIYIGDTQKELCIILNILEQQNYLK